jgi:hypothetical protein
MNVWEYKRPDYATRERMKRCGGVLRRLRSCGINSGWTGLFTPNHVLVIGFLEAFVTVYLNFIQDFPKRCRDILDNYWEDAKRENREVTLLVAVATSAFTIPLERLNPSAPGHIADDRYPEAVRKVGRLQNRKFTSWQKGASWKIVEALDSKLIQTKQADAWASPRMRQPIPDDKKVGSILGKIRNALAHGSIFAYPRPVSRQKPVEIEAIFFLARRRDEITKELIDKYDVVIASPDDFRAFILDWILLLDNLKLPTLIMQENISPA